VGETIEIPSIADLRKRFPDLCPSQKRSRVMRQRMTAVSTGTRYDTGVSYLVQEGDTLFDIARYKLGSGSRWPEIYHLNRDLLQGDFDYLTPGMRLSLPNETPDTVTRRPGASAW
jgi:nucleoid-associated protein YgaU